MASLDMLHVQLNMSSLPIVSVREVRAALETSSSIIVLEALPARYFQQGHLPGARQIPHDESLAQVAPQLISGKAVPVIVYCASATCENSREAAERLQALGYTQVSVFEGGKAAWKAAGLAFETTEIGGAA
jgi:rhodanese-related sulfurtransferase